MIYKPLTVSKELAVLRILNARMKLSDKDKRYYHSLEKGYQGEVLFNSYTEKLTTDCLILNDLLLQVNHTTFQIDSTIIFSDSISFHEVKFLEGEYLYEGDHFYKLPKSEVNNPLVQLARSTTLFGQLLKGLGSNLPIKSLVIFNHPEFTLWQAPLHKPYLLPSQITRYVERLEARPSLLTATHHDLAHKLASLHITESPFSQIPTYCYDDLEKGISCPVCFSISTTIQGRKVHCLKCQHSQSLHQAILRQVNEIRVLFPEFKITTNLVYDWCLSIQSRKVVYRSLKQQMQIHGMHQWSHYELKEPCQLESPTIKSSN